MKFDLTQLDPITREFVQSNPGGSAIQVSSRGQRLYYLAVVLLLLFLLKFRWQPVGVRFLAWENQCPSR